jgi:hypothetical protein
MKEIYISERKERERENSGRWIGSDRERVRIKKREEEGKQQQP